MVSDILCACDVCDPLVLLLLTPTGMVCPKCNRRWAKVLGALQLTSDGALPKPEPTTEALRP